MNINTLLAFGLGVIVSNEEYRKIAMKYSDKAMNEIIKQGSDYIKSTGVLDNLKASVQNETKQ